MAGTGIVKVTKYIQSVDYLLNDRGQSTPVVYFEDSFVLSVLDNETYLSYNVDEDAWYFDIGGCLPNKLSGLIDVSFNNLTDQNFLVYDAASDRWINDSSIIQNLQFQISNNATDILNNNNTMITNQFNTDNTLANIDTHLTNIDTDISNLQSAVGIATVPIGGIMLWSGSVVPTGWLLCDGTQGTPNLLDRFVVGGTLAEVNQNGGGDSPKNPIISYAAITLYEGNLPPHQHGAGSLQPKANGADSIISQYDDKYKTLDDMNGIVLNLGWIPGSASLSGRGGMSWPLSISGNTDSGGGSSVPIDVYPQSVARNYYVLAYIMFAP